MLAGDSVNLCSRIRFACKDVIDLQADKWIKTGAAVVVKYKSAQMFTEEARLAREAHEARQTRETRETRDPRRGEFWKHR